LRCRGFARHALGRPCGATAARTKARSLDHSDTALTARLDQIDKREDSYLALVGNAKWLQARLEAKIDALREEREGIEADPIKTRTASTWHCPHMATPAEHDLLRTAGSRHRTRRSTRGQQHRPRAFKSLLAAQE
jgi:hypothetical protein